MKFLFRAVVVLILLALVGIGVLAFYVDGLAKKAIEGGATHALGVPTTVERADIGLLSGKFSLTGLQVDNPKGFDTPHFLKLNDGGVSVTLPSLLESQVELPVLTLTGLDMNLQRSGDQANYQVILENLKRFESADPQDQPADGGGKRFVIRELAVNNVTVNVDLLPVGGKLSRVSVPIETIKLTDVGSDSEGGVLLTELTDVLIKAIMQAVVEKGGVLIPSELLGELQTHLAQLQNLDGVKMEVVSKFADQLSGFGGQLNQSVDDLKSGQPDVEKLSGDLKQAGDDLKGKADETMKGLGDLLGGSKEKNKDKDKP